MEILITAGISLGIMLLSALAIRGAIAINGRFGDGAAEISVLLGVIFFIISIFVYGTLFV